MNLSWVAEFKNGTKLGQYDQGIERTIRDVLDKEDLLTWFLLEDDENVFGVNVTDGSFRIGDTTIPIFNPIGLNYRLIYFRTVNLHFGGMEMLEQVDYYIGWQTTYNDRNYKLILKITNDGKVGFTNIIDKGDIRKDIMKTD